MQCYNTDIISKLTTLVDKVNSGGSGGGGSSSVTSTNNNNVTTTINTGSQLSTSKISNSDNFHSIITMFNLSYGDTTLYASEEAIDLTDIYSTSDMVIFNDYIFYDTDTSASLSIHDSTFKTTEIESYTPTFNEIIRFIDTPSQKSFTINGSLNLSTSKVQLFSDTKYKFLTKVEINGSTGLVTDLYNNYNFQTI